MIMTTPFSTKTTRMNSISVATPNLKLTSITNKSSIKEEDVFTFEKSDKKGKTLVGKKFFIDSEKIRLTKRKLITTEPKISKISEVKYLFSKNLASV